MRTLDFAILAVLMVVLYTTIGILRQKTPPPSPPVSANTSGDFGVPVILLQSTTLTNLKHVLIIRVGDTCQAVFSEHYNKGYWAGVVALTSWGVPCP